MKYTILLRNGRYALLDMHNQYAVVVNLDEGKPENQQWDYGTYYTHWNQSKEDKQVALANALEQFRMRTEPNYIHRNRLEELATQLKDGLIEADEAEAMEYFDNVCEMSDEEKEWFGIEAENGDYEDED